MRVIVFIKADNDSEAGVMPSEQLVADMTAFNEELVKSGVMLEGEGLYPSSKGKKARFAGGKMTVFDGPFNQTREVVAGYWVWQVKSMEEAVEWAKRIPIPKDETEGEVEIRPIFEAMDFDEDYSPEIRAREARMEAELSRRKAAR